MDVLATASRRLGWSVSVAKDAEKAVEFFQNRGHELVIIDHRGQRSTEANAVCRYGKILTKPIADLYSPSNISRTFEHQEDSLNLYSFQGN